MTVHVFSWLSSYQKGYSEVQPLEARHITKTSRDPTMSIREFRVGDLSLFFFIRPTTGLLRVWLFLKDQLRFYLPWIPSLVCYSLPSACSWIPLSFFSYLLKGGKLGSWLMPSSFKVSWQCFVNIHPGHLPSLSQCFLNCLVLSLNLCLIRKVNFCIVSNFSYSFLLLVFNCIPVWSKSHT